MSVRRSTLSFGFLLPPPAHRPIRHRGLRATQAPKRRQIIIAYGFAVLALGFVLLVFAAAGAQAPNALDQSHATASEQQRLELHSGAPLLPMPVP